MSSRYPPGHEPNVEPISLASVRDLRKRHRRLVEALLDGVGEGRDNLLEVAMLLVAYKQRPTRFLRAESDQGFSCSRVDLERFSKRDPAIRECLRLRRELGRAAKRLARQLAREE